MRVQRNKKNLNIMQKKSFCLTVSKMRSGEKNKSK